MHTDEIKPPAARSLAPAHAGRALAPGRVTRRYVAILLLLLGTLLIPLLLNILVDPLWYFAGNLLGGYNYAFNERVSKANLFNRRAAETDCLILGSSRTTLLDENRITGRRCFNYSVSQAGLEDDLAIADYVLARGLSPATLILGLDGFLFSENHAGTKLQMPDFYQHAGEPPNPIAAYLSVDTFDFTWRTLQREAPNGRYYDRAFVVHAIPGVGPFRPDEELTVPESLSPDTSFNQFSLGPFSSREELATLRKRFPQAELIAYVPPVTAQYPARLELAGTLDSYLETIHAAKAHFDAIYDFSVPSAITRDPTNTYDGSHFYKDTNDRIAAILARPGAPIAQGLAVHTLPLAEYKARYRSEVTRYLASYSQRKSTR